MNRILTGIICLMALTVRGQISIMLYPLQGMELKPSDVFRANIQSQEATPIKIYFVGSITNKITGEKLMTAKSAVIDVVPGLTTLSESMLAPQYQITSSSASQTGVFSYGNYNVCLKAYKLGGVEEEATDCQESEITPMSPPLLLSPENQSTIDQPYPLLVWLPPMPVSKNPVLYDLKLVEILPNQTPYDAIQRNFAVMEQQHIQGTSLQYGATSLKLEDGKRYAWKVYAKTSDNKPIGETEVWWFKKVDARTEKEDSITRLIGYVQMKEQLDSYFIIAQDELNLLYNEKYGVSPIKFRITDVGGKVLDVVDFKTGNVGLNEFSIDLKAIGGLKRNKFYVIEAVAKNRATQYLVFKKK